MTTPAEERCDTTELLVTQCGCPKHRAPADAEPDHAVSHWFAAAYPGRCAACDEPIGPGDRIGSTDDGYICEDCAP